MRRRILLLLIAILGSIFAILTTGLYRWGNQWFLSQYLEQKLVLARAVSSAISGDEYLQFNNYEDTLRPSYVERIAYLRSVSAADPDITYLFTLLLKDEELTYALDGQQVRKPTIWMEHEDFSLVLEFDDQQWANINLFQENYKNTVEFDHDGQPIAIEYLPEKQLLVVNGQPFLEILGFDPIVVRTPLKLLKPDLLQEARFSTESLPGTNLEVSVSIGQPGESTILPGEEVLDDEEFLEHYRELIEKGESFISDQYLDGSYGLYMTVMAPIHDSAGQSVGLTIIEVYDHRIEQFRMFILSASIAISLFGIAVPGILIMFLLNRRVLGPVQNLYETVVQVESGDYTQRCKLKTGDEMESLAVGMNHMIESIENNTRDLERQVADRTRDLQAARDRAENLLLNILPEPIAERLKSHEELIVDRFEDASVLFADIVGFTSFSASRSPDEVVEMLNGLFSKFDQLSESLGLEKIKTIGDAYMVAGGLPIPGNDHPERIAGMALEMQRYISIQLHDGKPLQIRIGIHCGPVIAGVIGTRKFIYDLWGDTVNTASRMESSGRDGTIQISEAFYHRIKDDFECSEPRQVNVKGKGMMSCYELLKRK